MHCAQFDSGFRHDDASGAHTHTDRAAPFAAGGQPLDLSGNGLLDAGDTPIITQNLAQGGSGGVMYLPRSAVIRYDYRNQMVENEYTDSSEIMVLHRFAYDCFGRRVRKVNDVYGCCYGPVTTVYVNGGPPGTAHWQVLEEQNAGGAPPTV